MFYVIIYVMEGKWELVGEGKHLIQLTRPPEKGNGGEKVSPVLSVGDVCRLLHRSRRQVYRYINRGNLKPCARILDQWLFAKEEVERFRTGKVPSSLRPLFWDVKLSDIDIRQHRDFVLSRVLEYGDFNAIRWALREYPRQELAQFLRGRGLEILSRRSWVFWTSQLGVKLPRGAQWSWRHQGRLWGDFS